MTEERSALTKIIDTKNLISAQAYDGTREAFPEWKWQFYITLGAIKKPLQTALKKVEMNLKDDYSLVRLSEEDQSLAE